MNAVINLSIILVIVIMQLDNLFVCNKVTDLVQNENPDLYKHYKGPYSLFKKKQSRLSSQTRKILSSRHEKLYFPKQKPFKNEHY